MSTAQAEVLDPPPFKARITRQYSHEERAKALALYDTVGSLDKASQTLGIPMSTLATWAQNDAHISESRTRKGLELAEKFDNAANLFIDLAVKKAKKAGFNHLMTGAGIAVDKSQLLRGEPTSITASAVSEEERQAKVREVLDRIAARAIDAAPAGPACITDGTNNE